MNASLTVYELLMLLICLLGAEEKGTFHLDVITPSRAVETVIVRPVEDGFRIFSSNSDDAKSIMEIQRDGDSEWAFDLTDPSGKEHHIDLRKEFPELKREDLLAMMKGELKTVDRRVFKVVRSGNSFYLTDPYAKVTFSVHE